MKSVCGANCDECFMKNDCKGCAESGAKPFGEPCMVAAYCKQGGCVRREFEQRMTDAFNALGIPDMPKVTSLNALRGAFVNLEYELPSGETVRIWNDNKILLGSQLEKSDSDRCYGIAGDEHYIMVAEYGENGAGAELVVFKRWN